MLLNLHVKNFALIDEADLDFGEGLNIFTGETGAGKSILIDSVNAALGSRVRGDVIQTGADAAYVELVFSVTEEEKKQALQERGVSTEYDCILVSRKIMDGRSVHKINDETVTSAKVRQVTELLLDLHGQHEHQSLLHKQKHLEILDQFAAEAADRCKREVEEAFARYQACKHRWQEFQLDPELRRREMDFLQYEIQEMEAAAIQPGETEELEQQYRRFLNRKKIADSMAAVMGELGDEARDGAVERISRAVRDLRDATALDASLVDYCSQLETVEDLLSGLMRELVQYQEDLIYDPVEFRQVEERLDLLHRLESKYGGSYEAMEQALYEKKFKFEEWNDYELHKINAEESFAEAETLLKEVCERLTVLRKDASTGLAEAIKKGLTDLNFPNVEFSIHFEALFDYTKQGLDCVEFMISTNSGERQKPLGQVASGGELSRIMLAIKALLSDKDQIPTLIFDEIDTGISGRTAQKVSEKLHEIAKHRQVLCITHLPQIAAMADRHFSIEKCMEAGKTHTNVHILEEDAAVSELARLLGGAEITETVYQNAIEMKELARRTKNH